MNFSRSKKSVNLVMTGAIALTTIGFASTVTVAEAAVLTVNEGVTTETGVQMSPPSDVSAAGDMVSPSQLSVTADSTITLNFERPSVTSVAAPPKVDPLIAVLSADPESQVSENFDVVTTIKTALSEVGQSFPTGWNQPGECLVAAKRWITAGGGNWFGAGTPIGNYVGAKEVDIKNAAPGDVVQYMSPFDPSSWVAGVHTVLVTKNNEDGTLQIVEANNPGGSGFVSENKSWTPAPPAGLIFKVFRF